MCPRSAWNSAISSQKMTIRGLRFRPRKAMIPATDCFGPTAIWQACFLEPDFSGSGRGQLCDQDVQFDRRVRSGEQGHSLRCSRAHGGRARACGVIRPERRHFRNREGRDRCRAAGSDRGGREPGVDREGALGDHRWAGAVSHRRSAARHVHRHLHAARVQFRQAGRHRADHELHGHREQRTESRRRRGNDHRVGQYACRRRAERHPAASGQQGDRGRHPQRPHRTDDRRARAWHPDAGRQQSGDAGRWRIHWRHAADARHPRQQAVGLQRDD